MARIDATDFVCTLLLSIHKKIESMFVENHVYSRHFCAKAKKRTSVRFLIFSAKDWKFRLEKGHSIVG
jgi:hypothetical protein